MSGAGPKPIAPSVDEHDEYVYVEMSGANPEATHSLNLGGRS